MSKAQNYQTGQVVEVTASDVAHGGWCVARPGAGAGRLAYVSCDPATLARDIGLPVAHGWVLGGLRAFDAFPMTHHVECVAIMGKDGPPGQGPARRVSRYPRLP